jgi:hypothetical protein
MRSLYGLGRTSLLIDQYESARDTTFCVLMGRLLQVSVEGFRPAIKAVSVVLTRKQFELKHGRVRETP